MAGSVMDDIDISSPPEFEYAPIDEYVGTINDEDDGREEITAFDIGVIVQEVVKTEPMPEPRKAMAPRKPKQPALNSMDEIEPLLELPESIQNTIIGRMSAVLSETMEFPQASVFIALLAGASSCVSTSYSTQYKPGTTVALGLYVVVEQPPATSKSQLMGFATNPYAMAIARHNKKIFAKNNENRERRVDPKDNMKPAFVLATDATTAAIDKNLVECSEGRFVIASAEKSALTSLFPEKGSFVSTNELILKGWPGEWVAGMRGSRAAYNGIVQGSILLVAQSNTARKILAESDGSGMAERFIFVAEPDYLGVRELLGAYPSRDDTAKFIKACDACIDIYSRRIFSFANQSADTRTVLEPENLVQLRPTAVGYMLILKERRAIEPRLGELKRSGDMVLLSWLGKFETHVLKFAGIMHVVECHGNGCEVPATIPESMILAAMELTHMLANHMEKLLHDAGESGFEAEETAVIEALTGITLELRPLVQKLRGRKPFKSMGNNAYKAAQSRVKAMMESGALLVSASGKIGIV